MGRLQILRDIHDRGLDPKKAHVHTTDGRLAAKIPIVPLAPTPPVVEEKEIELQSEPEDVVVEEEAVVPVEDEVTESTSVVEEEKVVEEVPVEVEESRPVAKAKKSPVPPKKPSKKTK